MRKLGGKIVLAANATLTELLRPLSQEIQSKPAASQSLHATNPSKKLDEAYDPKFESLYEEMSYARSWTPQIVLTASQVAEMDAQIAVKFKLPSFDTLGQRMNKSVGSVESATSGRITELSKMDTRKMTYAQQSELAELQDAQMVEQRKHIDDLQTGYIIGSDNDPFQLAENLGTMEDEQGAEAFLLAMQNRLKTQGFK